MKKIIFLIGILISINSFAQAPFRIRNKEIDLLYVNDSMSIRLGTNYVEHRTDKKGFDFGQSVHLDTLFYEYLNPPVVGSTITFEYSYDRITWGAYSYGKRYFRTSDDGGSTWKDTVLFFSGNTPAQVTLFEYGDEPYSAYDPRWGGQTAASDWMHFSLNNGGTWSDPIPITQSVTDNLYQYSDDTVSWTYTYALQKWMHFGTDSVNWSQPILLRDDGAIGSIVVKYSRDSALYWRNTYNDSTLYIKLSVDGGISYSNAIQINDTINSSDGFWTKIGNKLTPTISTNYINTDSSIYIDGVDLIRYDKDYYKVVMGYNATKNTGLTTNSVIIGDQGLYQSSGSFNKIITDRSVIIGYQANSYSVKKDMLFGDNVIIGSTAANEMFGSDSSSSSGNFGYTTLIGASSGYSADSVSDLLTGLGYSTLAYNKGQNIIAIGQNAGSYNRKNDAIFIGNMWSGSDYDTVGGLIYGNEQANNSRLNINGKIKSVFGAANSVVLDTTNGIKLSGTATVFEDLRIDGISLGTGADAPAMTGSFAGNEYFSQRMFQASGQDDKVFFNVQLPHSWKEGGEFEMHIHTSPWTEPSAGDTVVWELYYMWENINGTFDSITTVTVKQPMNGIPQWGHKLVELEQFVTTSKTISSVLVCSLYRLGQSSASDTYSGGVTILYVDCHYERDGIGSGKELIK